jgi:transcriptional regulator GlxA family with amidase domain
MSRCAKNFCQIRIVNFRQAVDRYGTLKNVNDKTLGVKMPSTSIIDAADPALRIAQKRGFDAHQMLVNRFRAIVEERTEQPFHMSEICQEIGVGGRTLRAACQEQLGQSPAQYVMLHRMRAARRALQEADPELMRATDIATEYGFWELGRFAVNYRHIFGESPSTTLRAPA